MKYDTIGVKTIFDSTQGGIYKKITYDNTGSDVQAIDYILNGNLIQRIEIQAGDSFTFTCIEGGTIFNSVFPFPGALVSTVGDGTNVFLVQTEITSNNGELTVSGEYVTNIPYPS